MHFIEVMAKIFIYPLTFNSEGNSCPINPTRFHNLEEEIEMGPHLCYNVMENRITNSVFFVKSNTKQINIFYFVSEVTKFKILFFSFSFFFWGGTSHIFIFKQFWPYFFTEWMVYFSYMIWWFSFPEIYPISGLFPDCFPDFPYFH